MLKVHELKKEYPHFSLECSLEVKWCWKKHNF